MKNRDKILDYFDNVADGTIVSANDMYEHGFVRMNQEAFFRAVERLSDEGEIIRVGRGMYIKKSDAQGDITELLLNYFFGEDNSSGMFTGIHLYNKYSLTNVKSDSISLYSNVCKQSVCHIGNIEVKRPAVELDFDNTRIIEAMEIFQNYYDIPELDKTKFARYAKQFARGYDDEAAVTVLRSMKYKARIPFYKSEISKCTYRQYTTGFFFGKPDENTQIYDSNTYIREYTYLGIVGDANEQGLYHIEQRNKFSVGETIEVMKPDGQNIEVTVKRIVDENGKDMESCPHPKQNLYIDLGIQLDKYDILRRQEEETEVNS